MLTVLETFCVAGEAEPKILVIFSLLKNEITFLKLCGTKTGGLLQKPPKLMDFGPLQPT
jgi:hypothetical protein